MALLDAQQIYSDLKSGKRTLPQLSKQELAAVQTHVALKNNAVPSAQQPLAATMQGQQTLKAQADQVISSQNQQKKQAQAQAVTPPPQTWGEQIGGYLAQNFPKTTSAIAGSSELIGRAISAPLGGVNPFTTMGASSSIVGDIAKNLSKPTGAELQFNAPSQFAQGVKEYYKDKPWYASPTEAINAGFEGINKASEFAPIQTVKNIYARNEMAKGATAQQGLDAAEKWVRENPNLAGTIANVGSGVLDPMNLVGGGAVSKLARGVERDLAGQAIKKVIPEMPTKKLTYIPPAKPQIKELPKMPTKKLTFVPPIKPTSSLPLAERQKLYESLAEQVKYNPDVEHAVRKLQLEETLKGPLPEPRKVPTLKQPNKKLTYVPPAKPTPPSGWSLTDADKQALYTHLAEQADKNPEIKRLVDQLEISKAFENLPEYHANIAKKHTEIDAEVKNVQDQLDQLNASHQKESQDVANTFWNRYVQQGKKQPKTSLDEMVQTHGYIRTPVVGDFHYDSYKTIPDALKRKYFRKDAKYSIDEFANDAAGQSANDFIDQLNHGKFPIMPEDQWIQDFTDKYGHAPTKSKLVEFFKEQADQYGVNAEHNQNVKALQDVLDELKKSKSELPNIPTKEAPAVVKKVKSKKSIEAEQAALQKEIEKNNAEIDASHNQRLGIAVGSPLGNLPIAAPRSQIAQDVVRAGFIGGESTIKKATNAVVQTAKDSLDKVSKAWEDTKLAFKPLGAIKDDNTSREVLFNGQAELSSVPNKVENILRNILYPIKDIRDMPLFRNLVLYRDLVETKLKDPAAKLPKNMSLKEAQDELDRLQNLAKGNSYVLKAIKNYDNQMRIIALDLVKRGILRMEDIRKNYFPHVVMEYADTTSKLGSHAESKGLKEEFRGYASKRGGSEKDLKTNFEEVIRNSLTKVLSDNTKQDTIRKLIPRIDVLPSLNIGNVVGEAAKKSAKEAKTALAATMTKDEYMVRKVSELTAKGVPINKAEGIARFMHINEGRVGYYREMKKMLLDENVPEANIDTIINSSWETSIKNPKNLFKELTDRPITVGDKPYRFFMPSGSNKLHLIPEGVYQEVKQFGQPLFSNEGMRIIYKGLGGIKTAWLTISAPGRILADSLSNAAKLVRFDRGALAYLPQAVRISLMNADNAGLKWLSKTLSEQTGGKYLRKDTKILKLLKEYHVVEPSKKIQGQFEYVPGVVQFLKTALSFNVMSQNLTRKSDELFRIMKASADYDRMVQGKPVRLTLKDKIKGAIVDPTPGLVDVEGLDKEFALTKTAKEFFVDSARQSRLTRKMQLLVPFLNWVSVDTLHNLRDIRTNPKKALAGMAGLVAGFEVWNNTGDRKKQEEQLSEAKRNMPHLNTGYTDEQGNPYIIYFPIFSGMSAAQMLGLPSLVHGVTDVAVGRKSANQAIEESLSDEFKYGKQTALGMVGPVKTLAEALTNRSLYTMSDIVPKSQQGTSEGRQKMIAYIASAFIPGLRNVSSADKQLQALQEGKVNFPDKISTALDNIFLKGPVNRFVKKENLAELGKSKSYDIQNKAQIAKNNAYAKLDDEFVNYFLTGSTDGITRIAQQNMLSSKEVKSHITATLPRIVAKALSQTTDPAKIAELKDMLNALNGKSAAGRYKASAKYNEEDARDALNMQLGGEQ